MLLRLLLISLMLQACERSPQSLEWLDEWAFSKFGRTLIARPALVTSKELHFDEGSLTGLLVSFRGTLSELGKFDSYMVLNDEGGRILVVLTHVELDEKLGGLAKGASVQVLGIAERGKKGLPFIRATSILSHPDN